MDYKVPGVYVEEIALFPPSVAAVATGIPAFVGHTAVVTDARGDTLINKPVRITSLLEFTQLFGGPYNPDIYTVQTDADFAILNVTAGSGNKYFLFDSVRLYFDNGGGPCYVVTVGSYTDDIIYGTDVTGLRGGLRALRPVDEPTILVIPESVSLRLPDDTPDAVQAGMLQRDMLEQCARLQDRFAVLDIVQGQLAYTPALITQFQDGIGTENLNYGAAYYPWLNTTYLKNVSFTQLRFIDDQAIPVPIPDATLDTMTGNAALDGLLTGLRTRVAEENRVFSKIAFVPVNRGNYKSLGSRFAALRQLVLTATTDGAAQTAFGNIMTFTRQLALSFADVEDDGGNSPALTQQLLALATRPAFQTQLTDLIAYEKNAGVLDAISAVRDETSVEADYALLDSSDWVNGVALTTIGPSADDFTNGGANSILETAREAVVSPALQSAFDAVSDAFIALADEQVFTSDQSEKLLFGSHPFLKAVYERVRKDMSLLPPSGAMAGVYASIDRTRGVWKAPANVSLRSVAGPASKLTDQEQGELNIPANGKSVNALRAFAGKGTLVWGARTLAGNDNEWRYVNVRRFFLFVEESTKKASEPFVFESNDANTWIRIRAMIENFLTIQWRQGALAGATAKAAFFVKVGLNETMTAQDILEGRLIVEIGMAVVRPAEFIILRFSHKMQES